MKVIDESDINSPLLDENVDKSTPLKEWLVEYVGNRYNPPDGQVTVEMIVNVISKEFPEFLMVVAEENWVRGYKQGLDDAGSGVSGDAPNIFSEVDDE
tara:strand:+ start:1226 stop:1519 length:294 start_codon:yes stop_codon:yes gene_type:complete